MRALSLLVTRRPWLVLLLWALLALLSAYPALLAPRHLSANPGELQHAESTQVTTLLRERFGETDTNTALLVTHSHPPLTTPEGQAAYDRFVAGLEQVPGVSRVLRAGAQGAVPTVSPDGTLALTVAQIPLREGASQTLARVRAYAAAAQSSALDVRVTGGQAIADDFTALAESDTKRSEFAALPLTALVLLGVFGALVATALPLVVGVLSITMALAGLYGLAQITEVSTFAQSVITMLGLGAGIDYALLMVNRFREELGRGGPGDRVDARAAAARTVQTAGRSVLFSGLTVAIAMAALILPPIAFVRSMGLGGSWLCS